MYNLSKHILVALVCLLLGTQPAYAAKKAADQNPPTPVRAGEVVETEYFSLTVPKGWAMPKPPQKKPLGTSLVFGKLDSGLGLTINVLQAPLTGKQVADQTAANMRKSGFKVKGPEKTGNFYKLEMENNQLKGLAYFAGNGKLCSGIVILVPAREKLDMADASQLLSAIKSPAPELFPKKMN